MKNFFAIIFSLVSIVGVLYSQQQIVTEELWSHPTADEWYPYHIALSPNGKYASYLSDKGNIYHLLDVQKGRKIRSYTDTIISESDPFYAIYTKTIFSPDSRFAAVQLNANGSRIKILSCSTGEILSTFIPPNPEHWVSLFAISPDGSQIAIEDDSTIYTWDWKANTTTHQFPITHGAGIGDFSPDGKYLVAIDYDYTVSVLRLVDGATMCTFNHKSMTNGRITDVSFSSNGQELIILGPSGKYCFTYWNPMTGAFLRGTKNTEGFFSVAIAPNRKIAMTNSYTTTLWDAEKGEEIKTIPIYNDLPVDFSRYASTLAPNEDGSLVLALTGYSVAAAEVELYDTEKGQLTATLTGTQITYRQYAKQYSLDDTKLLGVGASKYKVWDIATGKTLYRSDELPVFAASSVVHSMVSNAVAFSTVDTIYLYDAIPGVPTAIAVAGKFVDGMEWSADGRYIAFRYHVLDAIEPKDYEPGVGVIDTKSQKIVKMIDLSKYKPYPWEGEMIIENISISPSSDRMAIVSGRYAVVSLPDLVVLNEFVSNTLVSTVRFAPDGSLVVVGYNGWKRLKQTATTVETVDEFDMPSVPTETYRIQYAISPDTRFCAFGYRGSGFSSDSLLVVWDIVHKKEVARFKSGIECAFLAFTPNNKLLISAATEGTISAWDIEVATTGVEEHVSVIPCGTLTVSPNPATDNFTVHCSYDGIIYVLDIFGRVMEQSKHQSNLETTIMTSYLPAGLYVVQIRTASGIIAKPIVIIH